MILEPDDPFAPFDLHAGDVSEHAQLLDQALKTRDTRLIVAALATIAKARGMTGVSRRSGISRSKLYRILGPNGDPSLSEILQLLTVMRIQLRATGAT